MSNVMAQTRNENVVYVDAALVDDMLQVRVRPDNRKNPNRDESGIWVVIGNVDGGSRVLARGTKEHCDAYVKESRKENAIKHEKELNDRIQQLLNQAEAKAKECSPGKTLAQQQALVKEVHGMTREAMLLASWFDDRGWFSVGAYPSNANAKASDIRRTTKLTYCGQELWNIRINAGTEQEALSMFKIAGSIDITAIENKKGTPKFMTHQVVCDGKVIAEGSERACQIFVRISNDAVEKIREAEEEAQAQAQWEAERKVAEQQSLDALSNIEARLQNGAHFAGKVQKSVSEIIATANKYDLDSVISRAEEIMTQAVSRFSDAPPIGAEVSSYAPGDKLQVGAA